MPNNTKEYLGDGVYIDMCGNGSLMLTTENGHTITNTIILEPEVVAAFEDYLRRLKNL